jgi:S1-C subfamily serine protease
MKTWKIVLTIAAVLLFSGQTLAQSDAEIEALEVAKVRQVEARREMEVNKAEYSERLREAEERMEQAARQIAEITTERLPHLVDFERRIEISNKPRLGITIEGSDDSGPVDGVLVDGVTPESAADDSGLRAGDIITAVNGDSMSGDNSKLASKKLLDFMEGVEAGDVLKLDYLRGGNAGTVDLSPKVTEMHKFFSWVPDVEDIHVARIPGVPGIVNNFKFDRVFAFAGGAWGRMELVELNEGLGKYFGTDSGLLVVSVPTEDGIELQDGDVIKTIDGRVPNDVRHAMRILSSYQSGEELKIGIMRDKKKRTLKVEVPADHRGSLSAPVPAVPVRAPAPPRPAPENVST